MEVSGKAVVFGDNVNTDAIIPGEYLTLLDPVELAKHAMEGIDPNFPQKARAGAVIVAGRNFGCGSSREQAPIALTHAGVRCVLAESFARIFYRNAINIGLPVLESPNVRNYVEEGDMITVNLEEGEVVNKTKNHVVRTLRLPRFILEILTNGGLIEHLRKRIGESR